MKCANCGHTSAHDPTCDYRGGSPEYPDYCRCTTLVSVEQRLMDSFKKSVLWFGDTIDPANEHDWFSLAYGWFLGQPGVSVDDARDMAWKVSHGELPPYDNK